MVSTVPCTVDVDRAALKHEVGRVALDAFEVEHLLADEVVGVPGEVEPHLEAPPGVELPVDAADLTLPR